MKLIIMAYINKLILQNHEGIHPAKIRKAAYGYLNKLLDNKYNSTNINILKGEIEEEYNTLYSKGT